MATNFIFPTRGKPYYTLKIMEPYDNLNVDPIKKRKIFLYHVLITMKIKKHNNNNNQSKITKKYVLEFGNYKTKRKYGLDIRTMENIAKSVIFVLDECMQINTCGKYFNNTSLCFC